MECGKALVMWWMVVFIIRYTSSTPCLRQQDTCYECQSLARCQTKDENAVIPKNLSETILALDILYTGTKSVTIGPGDFWRYLNLKGITLKGREIRALENGTFAKLHHLKKLELSDTSIKVIPLGFLSPINFIATLNLHQNLLTDLPYHLFDTLEDLEELDLGFNMIVLRSCLTIGEEFRKIKKLKILDLSNTSVKMECEPKVPAEFFKPIQKTVQKLKLSACNFYGGSPEIFSNLTTLVELDISLAKGFLGCPSDAAELFHHLPHSLRTLVFRRWRTDSVMNSECAVNSSTMAMLKRLQLHQLDMKFGDFIFGQTLKRNIFAGFNNLSELNIGHTRFSAVEKFVFNECPNLTFVTMDGNPLGSRPMQLYENRTFSKLEKLSIRFGHLFSDDSLRYNATQLILDSPLKMLNLRRNFFVNFPIFASNLTNERMFESLQSIQLDYNYLQSFEGDGNLSVQCVYLKNLRTFTATFNQLESIEGLCPSITYLNLASNKLNVNWDPQNQQVISQLRHLEFLDLSYNQINYFSNHIFSHMKNLTQLILKENNLSHIADTSFHFNHFLQVLDLRANKFTSFNVSSIQHLHALKKLLVEDNDITSIDTKLVDYLNASDNSITTFGIIGNPLLCRCDQEFFQQWIKETNKVPYSKELLCSGPTKFLQGQKVYEYKRDDYYCDYKEVVKVVLSLLAGVLAAAFIAVPCYKYRWYILHAKIVLRAVFAQLSTFRYEEICQYSAYVMYNSTSEEDLNWVSESLLPAIERDVSDLEPDEVYIHPPV